MSLLGFVARRILRIIPTTLFVLIAIFVLVRLLPGNPVDVMLGERAQADDIARLNALMGLDQPVWVQFVYFMRNMLTGDLGQSITLRTPVAGLLLERLPVTLGLVAMAALFALLMAIPLAFLGATKRGQFADLAARGFAQISLSTPVFYAALVLLTVFAARLGWFPVGGFGDTFLEHIYHLFLPAITLALSLSAVLMRNLRASIIGVMDFEYVQFARAKGLRLHVVLLRHVLRNSLISTVTLFGLLSAHC